MKERTTDLKALIKFIIDINSNKCKTARDKNLHNKY